MNQLTHAVCLLLENRQRLDRRMAILHEKQDSATELICNQKYAGLEEEQATPGFKAGSINGHSPYRCCFPDMEDEESDEDGSASVTESNPYFLLPCFQTITEYMYLVPLWTGIS